MKPLITGDWHIRSKKPRNRIDPDYKSTVYNKISFISETAKKYKCDAVFQPGDMFDDADISDRTIRETIKVLNDFPCYIFTVPGQHDLRYHSRVWENTPLGIADAFGWPVIVVDKPVEYSEHNGKKVVVYGAGFGEDIPEPDPDVFSILLCHKLIVKSSTPFAFDFSADEIQKKYPYNLIISGDNHQSFENFFEGRMLINCGSLMRTKIDQEDHKPCIYVASEGGSLRQVYLPVSPFSEIMDVKKAREEKEKNIHLENFIDKIKETQKKGSDEELNFEKRLVMRTNANNNILPKGAKDILLEVMDDEQWTNSR